MSEFECKECGEEKDFGEECKFSDKLDDTWVEELVSEHGYCTECAESVALEEPEVLLLAWLEEVPTYMFTQSKTDKGTISMGSHSYLVLEWEEAEKRAKASIIESVEELDLEQVPEFLQPYLDLDEYAQDVVDVNGAGMTLATYDGHENEVEGYIDGTEYQFHIFRTN